MLNQPERLMYQMYEKELKLQVSTSFNYIGLTNRPDLIERLQSVSRVAMRVVFQVIGQMQMRPFANVEEIIAAHQVEPKWADLGIRDKGQRSRVARELIDIGFWARHKGTYVINLWYLSGLTKKQHEQLSHHLQMMRFTINQR